MIFRIDILISLSLSQLDDHSPPQYHRFRIANLHRMKLLPSERIFDSTKQTRPGTWKQLLRIMIMKCGSHSTSRAIPSQSIESSRRHPQSVDEHLVLSPAHVPHDFPEKKPDGKESEVGGLKKWRAILALESLDVLRNERWNYTYDESAWVAKLLRESVTK